MFLGKLICGLAAIAIGMASHAHAASSDRLRIALVIANATYQNGSLQTPANDGRLVSMALSRAGFEVVTRSNLGQAGMRNAFHEFVAQVEAKAPDAVAFVYFTGYGLEYNGENYLVPSDARLARVGDIPIEAVRLAELLRPLGGVVGVTKIISVDASRPLPFALADEPMAPGLSAMSAQPGVLIATSCAPGTLIEDGAGPNGAYAIAIAEATQNLAGGFDDLFVEVRKRTFEATAGRQKPWHTSGLPGPIAFGQRDGPGGVPFSPDVMVNSMHAVKETNEASAYAAAIATDSLSAYGEYLAAYPSGPHVAQVLGIVRTRRDALYWRSAVELNTAEGFWTYLGLYPDGIYAADAARRLLRISAKVEPPLGFEPLVFDDVTPPLPAESSAQHADIPAPGLSQTVTSVAPSQASLTRPKPILLEHSPGDAPAPGLVSSSSPVQPSPDLNNAALLPTSEPAPRAGPGSIARKQPDPLPPDGLRSPSRSADDKIDVSSTSAIENPRAQRQGRTIPANLRVGPPSPSSALGATRSSFPPSESAKPGTRRPPPAAVASPEATTHTGTPPPATADWMPRWLSGFTEIPASTSSIGEKPRTDATSARPAPSRTRAPKLQSVVTAPLPAAGKRPDAERTMRQPAASLTIKPKPARSTNNLQDIRAGGSTQATPAK